MKFTNIIFDFDGTLVDTRPGLVAAFQSMMEEMGVVPADENTIIGLIGVPLRQVAGALLSTNNENLLDKASESFRKNYSKEENIRNNILFDGILELLEVIKKNHGQNFIVSNKIDVFLSKILEQHDLKKMFTAVRATDGKDAKSKKSDYVEEVMKSNNLDKAKTCIVGDTKSDIIAGKNNSIYNIGITWGYGTKEDLSSAGADIIFESVEELKNFLLS